MTRHRVCIRVHRVCSPQVPGSSGFLPAAGRRPQPTYGHVIGFASGFIGFAHSKQTTRHRVYVGVLRVCSLLTHTAARRRQRATSSGLHPGSSGLLPAGRPQAANMTRHRVCVRVHRVCSQKQMTRLRVCIRVHRVCYSSRAAANVTRHRVCVPGSSGLLDTTSGLLLVYICTNMILTFAQHRGSW